MRNQREILSNIFPPKHKFKQLMADSPLAKKDRNLSGFEKGVYRAVVKIPSGEVRSYKWVAKMLGRPNAYRAVGNALNKNPYPPIIPCHRVIKSDGSIGGYSKGIRLKIKMLKAEGIDLTDSCCYNYKENTKKVHSYDCTD